MKLGGGLKKFLLDIRRDIMWSYLFLNFLLMQQIVLATKVV